MGNENSRNRISGRRSRDTTSGNDSPIHTGHDSSGTVSTHSLSSQPVPTSNLSTPVEPVPNSRKTKSMSKGTRLVSGSPRRIGPNFNWMNNRDTEEINSQARMTLVECETSDLSGRLIAEHAAFRILFNGNYSSPVHDQLAGGGMRVLDVGCGAGKWALEMAADYPHTEIIGIDIKPDLLPSGPSVPRNCEFVAGDVTESLSWPDDHFDFIYVRALGLNLRKDKWRSVLSELSRVCKSGGYIECVEIDVHFMNCGPAFEKWSRAVSTWLESRNIDPRLGTQIGKLLGDAPYLRVVKNDTVSAPIGWNDGIGDLVKCDVQGFFVAIKTDMLKILGVGSDEYDRVCTNAMEECLKYETFLNLHYTYALKGKEL